MSLQPLRAVVVLSIAVVCVGCGSAPGSSPTGDAGQRPPLRDAESAREAGASLDATTSRPVSFSEEEWATLRVLAPEPLPAARPDPSNRWADDPAARALGRRFFDEPGFAGALLDVDNDGGPNALGAVGDTGRVACAGCHIESAGFADDRSTFAEISLGAGWTTRRTPSLLDVGQASLVLWGGRHSTLHGQVFGPFENPLEMNTSRLFVATYVADHHRAEYEAVFGEGSLAPLADTSRFVRLAPTATGCRLTRPVSHPRALPPDDLYECRGMPGDGAEFDAMPEPDRDLVTRVVVNVGKAIAAFERTLACGPGRVDAFVHGDATALTAAEQRGLVVFFGRGDCVRCHSGPFLSDQAFHNVGVEQGPTREGIVNDGDRGAAADVRVALADPLGVAGPYSDGDDGRLSAEVPPGYEGAFRTPTLRCVGERPSFMHTGLDSALREAMRSELRAYVDFVLWEGDARLETLLTARVGHVNEALASLYGIEAIAGDELVRVELPDHRAGILTQAGFLSVHADRSQSSPILRGKFVRERMLCQELPDPPADAMIEAVPEPDADSTTRERFEQHRSDPACAACHQLMDPIGFGFEGFDAVGRFRTTDGSGPVDDLGELNGTDDADGSFEGAVELSQRLAGSEQVHGCVAEQWLEFALGRPAPTGHAPDVEALRDVFLASDGDLLELLIQIVRSDSFMHRDGLAGEMRR